MKNLGFLFSALAFMILAQNSQSVADDKCTNVIVTYTGLDPDHRPPLDYRQIAAWGNTTIQECGKGPQSEPIIFELPNTPPGKDTVAVVKSLEQGQRVKFSQGNSNTCKLEQNIKDATINIECRYDHGICQKCTPLLGQKSKSL